MVDTLPNLRGGGGVKYNITECADDQDVNQDQATVNTEASSAKAVRSNS